MPGVGSMWTWTALCADTKLLASWQLGARDAANANAFIGDIAEWLANRVQMTTDGNRLYLNAVERRLGGMVDYAELIKLFGNEGEAETRYSPGKCLRTKKQQVDGTPDMDFSYAERQNLNIRMQNRRYMRLTNAFSKKAEMLAPQHRHHVLLPQFRPCSSDDRHDPGYRGGSRQAQAARRRHGRLAARADLQHPAQEGFERGLN
jgi:IS1 family transposase